jgi:hypothetical protein
MSNYYPLLQGRPRWGMEIQERLLDEALQVANVPGDVIREQVRPPLRQVIAFRPREGYPSKQERQIRIEDVIDVNRIYSDPRINWTGTPAGYSGSSRESNEQS